MSKEKNRDRSEEFSIKEDFFIKVGSIPKEKRLPVMALVTAYIDGLYTARRSEQAS